ncbi:hypothetical protein H072_1215 [Dactylellina haptotyla CBS 200.50]|uniref:Uncharacterized protein n=1 Tax=Dactylellina haptotyla (strain CBS 200.50) TaxID=1284197 RepID=S8AV15_DACHA|nr:hypothetical protein H072_1215 [Dactylellina haptotyla CBS 200.50]
MKWTQGTLTSALLLAPLAVLAEDSLCDRYTKIIFRENTGSNQYSFMTRLVNTALIGNYTGPSKVNVTGILMPGTYDGQEVSLLPFFNGGLNSTNRGLWPSIVNFIDDGGALALAQNKPAYGQRSNQFNIFSHMYQFFGGYLGCSLYGKDGFPAYHGNPRMYEVHKYMGIGPVQLGYFIQEFGQAAASLGVAEGDVITIISTLNSTFGQRCAPPIVVLPDAEPDLQAICLNTPCPVALNPICDSYNHIGGFAYDPETAAQTGGPQATDLVNELNGGPPPMTTMDISFTTTIDGSESVISTYTVVPAGPPPISFSTRTITVSTNINGVQTVVPALTVFPIGGAIYTTGTETLTSSDEIYEQEYTSVIPSSVIEFISTVITTRGSVITTLLPTTVPNPALVVSHSGSILTTYTSTVTSGGVVFLTTITTEIAPSARTTTRSPNAAPTQTAGALLAAVVGAGLIGQML